MCGKDTFGEGIHGLLVVRIQFAIFTIVRLIPQARTWETNCASAPPNCSYSDRIVLYLQLSRLTNIVITLLALPLLELPN